MHGLQPGPPCAAGNWLHVHRRNLPAAACRSFVIPIARAAGSLKRVDPDTSEELILYRTMLDLIKPKLVYLDLPLFMALLSDLFPGVEMPALDGGVLRAAIEQDLRDSGLQVGCEAPVRRMRRQGSHVGGAVQHTCVL